MTTRADLEKIVADPGLKEAFEERLKKMLNYHLIAFWISARALRQSIEVRGASFLRASSFFFFVPFLLFFFCFSL